MKRIPTWLLILIVAGALRVVNLGSESLWYDEAFTAQTVREGADFWQAVTGDTHPPLWSIVQWFNVRIFGASEFAFRLPAFVFNVLAVLLAYLIARQVDVRIAPMAGLLAAVMPGVLYYAQDGRMYSLLAFTVLLALYAALRRNYYVFSLAAMAAAYTQIIGVFYVAAIGLGALALAKTWHERANVAIACAAAALAFAPWLIVLVRQAQVVGAFFWKGPMDLPNALWPVALPFGMRLPEAFYVPVFVIAFAAAFGGLIALRHGLLHGERTPTLLVMGMFAGPAAFSLVCAVWRNVAVTRAFLPTAVLLPILYAAAWHMLSRPVKLPALATFAPALVVCLMSHYTIGLRQDVNAWLAPIRDQWRDGDVIYHIDATTWVTYSLYAPDLSHGVLPGPSNVVTVSEACREAFKMPMMGLDELQSRYRRAWLIVAYSPFTSTVELEAIDEVTGHFNWPVAMSQSDELMRDEIRLVWLQY
jgi:4-amino-4-deoxy-L-arabinose transferase-like glycosyltransferase